MFATKQTIATKFRHATGGLYTRKLFFEMANGDTEQVLYTLKDRDWVGTSGAVYPSLYLLYLAEEDTFEFNFANKYFENYDHWLTITKTDWFEPVIARWRNELSLKIQSQALVRLREDARTTSRSAFASNRYLLERGWSVDAQTKTGRGRPSKEQIRAEAKRQADLNREVEDDLARLTTPQEVPSTETVN